MLKDVMMQSIARIKISSRMGSNLYRRTNGYHNYIMIFTLIMKRDIIPNLQQITSINTSSIKTRTPEKTATILR